MLTFDAESHVYRWAGQVVPGVTTILRPLTDWSHVDPAVLQAKAELGTSVHLACELDDKGELDDASVHERVAPYLSAWRRFRAETGASVTHNERQVYDNKRGFAGTLDRVLLIDGRSILTDLKTSATVMPAVGPQTAAYQFGLRAEGIEVDSRAVVQLKPDGSYRYLGLTDPSDSAVFQACLAIHRFKEKHA